MLWPATDPVGCMSWKHAIVMERVSVLTDLFIIKKVNRLPFYCFANTCTLMYPNRSSDTLAHDSWLHMTTAVCQMGQFPKLLEIGSSGCFWFEVAAVLPIYLQKCCGRTAATICWKTLGNVSWNNVSPADQVGALQVSHFHTWCMFGHCLSDRSILRVTVDSHDHHLMYLLCHAFYL